MMHGNSPAQLLLAALAIAVIASPRPSAAQNPGQLVERHAAGKTITVTGLRDAQQGEVEVLEYDGDNLVVKGEYGELTVPVGEQTWRGLQPVIEEFDKIDVMLRRGEYQEVLPLIRREIYPYLKFATLPREFTQIHRLIERLFLVLDQNQLNEEIVHLIGEYPAVARQQSLHPMLIAALDKVRAKGQFAKMAGVYGGIAANVEELRQEATAMRAYCQAQAGDLDGAERTLQQLGELTPDDEAFSERQLAMGIISLLRDQPREALDAMSRGLVHANPTDGWIPEATFFIGDAYQLIEKYDAALGAYQEVFKLDLNPDWSQKSERAYNKLKEIVRRKKQRESQQAADEPAT